MDYTAQGHTVGLAQRMEALAESGHICLSEHTARLVDGFFRLTDLGRVKVKGAGEPVGAFDLEDVGDARTRFDVSRARGVSPFVGRDADVQTLEAALEQARAGNGQVVGIVAEAGTGKSRLCFEFLQRCKARGRATQIGRALSHGKNIPLVPMLEVFRAYFGIAEGDADRLVRDRIAGRLLLTDEQSSVPIFRPSDHPT